MTTTYDAVVLSEATCTTSRGTAHDRRTASRRSRNGIRWVGQGVVAASRLVAAAATLARQENARPPSFWRRDGS